MESPTRRILLAGATGYIGAAVARELLARDFDVVAIARRETDLPDLELKVACLDDARQLTAALGDTRIDAAVSCIASRSGTPEDAWRVDYEANRNLLGLAQKAGASRFLLLSAICVQKPRLAFQHAKLAFERELADSGIDFTIVRPTAFFKSLSGQIERVRAGKPFLVFGDGTETACKPIGEADLARFIADSLGNPAARNRILPIGGPGEAISPRQQGELLFELTGMPIAFRSVPPGMFTIAHRLLAPIGRIWPAARRKAELARIGHYYATESMLLWDADQGRYDADATPSTGTTTLRDFYAHALEHGLDGQALGDHKVF